MILTTNQTEGEDMANITRKTRSIRKKETAEIKEMVKPHLAIVKTYGVLYEATLKYHDPTHGVTDISKLIMAIDKGEAKAIAMEFFAHEATIDFYVPEKGNKVYSYTLLKVDTL